MESLSANDPLLGEPGVLLQVLHNVLGVFALCGRAHSTPPSICTFLRPSTVLAMPACSRVLFGCPYTWTLRLSTVIHRSAIVACPGTSTSYTSLADHVGSSSWNTHAPAQNQPASQPAHPPCLHACYYSNPTTNDSRKSGTRSLSELLFSVHSQRTTTARSDSSLVTPNERDRLPRRQLGF